MSRSEEREDHPKTEGIQRSRGEKYLVSHWDIWDGVQPCVTLILEPESRDGAIVTLKFTHNPRTLNGYHAPFAALGHKRKKTAEPEILCTTDVPAVLRLTMRANPPRTLHLSTYQTGLMSLTLHQTVARTTNSTPSASESSRHLK